MTPRIANETPITVTGDVDVQTVAQQMRARRVGCVIVVKERRPIGIVTDRDLALRVVAAGLPATTKICEVMTPDPITADASAGIETMLRVLRNSGTRRLPLVHPDGSLAAIVTHDDLVPFLARELRSLGEAIERSVDSSELRE
jgi:CBS domain-containing protein